MISTLAISILTTLVYLFFSGGQPYIYPLEKVGLLGVTGTNILGAFTYSFIHIGIKHLIGNLVILLAIGYVLEKHIGSKHTLGVYLASGIGAGIVYVFLKPNVWVVGASAAISGLIISAYLVDIKKATIALLGGFLALTLFIYPLTDLGLNYLQDQNEAKQIQVVKQANLLKQEVQSLEQDLNKINQVIEEKKQLPQTPEVIKEIQEKELEKNLVVEQKVEKEEQVSVVQKQQEVVIETKESVEKGREKESVTPASYEIHLLGILFALAYLYLFKRSIFSDFKKGYENVIKPRNKKSRRRTKKK